ncbi:MAG: hypothetical protein KA371_11110 [Acidobacteria bacterium]|jgi:CheY-like chemotaxis protein|nr:hypothetical protein [Acidobacteriota bacterium]
MSPRVLLVEDNGANADRLSRRLKGQAATAGIPTIALTAHAMVADRAKCVDAGYDEFETTPIDLQRLLQKMRALLGARTMP